jgi:small subunit ribosomal protein S8e
VYNASNNKFVWTNTLVKGTTIQIDATPFRPRYESHYAQPVSKKLAAKAAATAEGKVEQEEKKSHHVERKLEAKKKDA